MTKNAALSRADIKLHESTNNIWRAIVPRGTQRERLLDSDLWATIAHDFLPYDKVIVVEAGRAFYAELLILEAGRGYCHLEELSFHALPPLIVANTGMVPNHEICHLGPDDLYGVRRLSDGVMLGKGFRSSEEAMVFLTEHASLR